MTTPSLKNTRVLLMGLGILGGGVATARWLLEQGAILTVNDRKTEVELADSLRELSDVKEKITFVFGGHHEADFLENDIIVVNPDIPKDNPFLRFAKEHGKQLENELTLFYKYVRPVQVIAVTGTRGKTTTSNWCAHLWKTIQPLAYTCGNSPASPLLAGAQGNTRAAVIESPSFLLEHFKELAPDVAVITNIYADHLNRYRGIEDYAATKANIFLFQSPEQKLVLNFDNSWTKFFLDMQPKGQLFFFSQKELPKEMRGVFLGASQEIVFREQGVDYLICHADLFIEKWGAHNLENLLAAIAATIAAGVPKEKLAERINSLPAIPLREELIYQSPSLQVINDSSATSPEANLAAIARFNKNANALVILGGTDRELDFSAWAKEVRRRVRPEQLIFLEGSATDKMLRELEYKKEEVRVFATLRECLECARKQTGEHSVFNAIVFSPGAKSFEKFKNEFDRGAQFTALVKEYFSL